MNPNPPRVLIDLHLRKQKHFRFPLEKRSPFYCLVLLGSASKGSRMNASAFCDLWTRVMFKKLLESFHRKPGETGLWTDFRSDFPHNSLQCLLVTSFIHW